MMPAFPILRACRARRFIGHDGGDMSDNGCLGSVARKRLLWLLAIVGLVAGLHGCTRNFYRKSADREVNDILAEKDRYGPWKIEQFHVYPDPRARFADPTNPDRPAAPPDDDAAFKLAPHPQGPGFAGVGTVEGTGYLDAIKTWDNDNRAERTEAEGGTKPDDAAPVGPGARRGALQELFDGPLTGQQGFLLTLDQSVELGLINSREFQTIREDLYLAALPVTQQRFSFAWQWAATENAVRNWAGADSSLGQQNNWSLGSAVGVSKLFSTGALLTAAFANNTVFNFLGGRTGFTSASTINLDLVQPFLRGGGRAVTLEPLTQVERDLVYSIRTYWRYREQFYLSIAIGSTPPGNLSVSAAGNSAISVLASLGIPSTDVSGVFRGYLPTLYREVDMAADKKYVKDLERGLLIFQGLQEGGQVAPLQVAQVTSTLLGARNGVLKDIQDTTNALDQLKLQLGIPANVPLLLDDSPARPITRQLDRFYDVLAESDTAYKRVDVQEQLPAEQLRAFLLKAYTTDPLVRGTEFQKKVQASWQAWAKANDKEIAARLTKLGQERRKLLDLKTDLEMKGQPLADDDAERLRAGEFEADLGGLEQVLRRYETKPWEKLAKEDQRRQSRNKSFRLVSYAAQVVLVSARNDRLSDVGKQWPPLPPTPLNAELDLQAADVETAQEAAVQEALANRVDLMNARAQVMDAWRQLKVTANALMGVLSVQYHLDTSTPAQGSNPLAFSTGRSHQELILNGQLPLVRIVERNNYRTALINYQRARRNLMSAEDNIAAQVRFDVRQLHLFAQNYKIQQKILESLYSQVENALEVIVAPIDPDSLKQTATQSAAAAAALTSQYLTALGGLNGAQTQCYRLWLSYHATRMELYLDLERLRLDNRGVWIDESRNASPQQLQPLDGGPAQAGIAGSGIRGAAFSEPAAGGERGAPAEQPVARPQFLPPPSGTRVE
jgi:hypothetical protein